jgi:hypothetical protein
MTPDPDQSMAERPEFDVPDAISYQRLRRHLAHASPDPVPPPADDPALDELLRRYAEVSQELLKQLQAVQQGADAGRRGDRQLMALGALGAHVQMGLMALRGCQN